MIAEVIIDSKAKKLNRKFDYKIPTNLEDIIEVGSRVLVPFANFKKLEEGYVIKIKDKTEFEVKEIAGLEENLNEDRMELARWMARKYFCNVSECIPRVDRCTDPRRLFRLHQPGWAGRQKLLSPG